MIDLLGIERDDLNTQFINFFKSELLSLIPKLNQAQLDSLLEASFTYTYIKELQPIIFSVIIQNKNIPSDYLISMSTPAVYDMCPIEVRRKIWVADPKSLYNEIEPLIASYFVEYTHSLSSSMILNKQQMEDENVQAFSPQYFYQFDWLTRYTRDTATRPRSVYDISDLVGNSAEVYTAILKYLNEKFLFSNEKPLENIERLKGTKGNTDESEDFEFVKSDPRYCALRCDLASVVQESKAVSINRPDVDPCYPIINIMESAILDGKTKPEFLKTLDTFIAKSVKLLKEEAFSTLSMIFSNPHYANMLFYNLVELIQLIHRNKKIAARMAAQAQSQSSSSSLSSSSSSSSSSVAASLSSPSKPQARSLLASPSMSFSPNKTLSPLNSPSKIDSKSKREKIDAKSKGGKNFRDSTKAKVAKHEAMVARHEALLSQSASPAVSDVKSEEELEAEEAAKIDPQNAPALLTLVKALDYAARQNSREKSGVLNALKLIHAIVDEENGPQIDWLLIERSILCRRIFLCHVSMSVFGSVEVPDVVEDLVNVSDSVFASEPAFSRSLITALIKKRKPTDKSKPLSFRTNIFNALLPRRQVLVVRSQLFRYLTLMIPNGKLANIVPLLEKVVAPLGRDEDYLCGERVVPVEVVGEEEEEEKRRYTYEELVLIASWKHFVKSLMTKVENDKSVEPPEELMNIVKVVVDGKVLSKDSASVFNISVPPSSSPCPPDVEDLLI